MTEPEPQHPSSNFTSVSLRFLEGSKVNWNLIQFAVFTKARLKLIPEALFTSRKVMVEVETKDQSSEYFGSTEM